MKPQLVVLAGPNGAGKSTFRDAFLSESPLPFLNADIVAAAAGVDSFEAARVLDATRERMIGAGESFITETVFSDPMGAKLAMLEHAVRSGYEVMLIFICVESAELSVRRVEQRVARGGHGVPIDRILSRYARTLENLKKAIPIVPVIELYDNSSVAEPFQLVATFRDGEVDYRAKGRLPGWTRGVVPPARRSPKS